ncbi:MAG TPA: T9SS type A sorting domain-containing protein, partial [Chitinophagaceae bacterium]|nr:T9SS type A sorting domain-containing protein [Chitinophagaceae bacterium]
ACWPLSASESGEPKSVDWEMYPNPACNKIVFKNAEGLGKTLFNTLGQLLCSIQGNEMDIHTLQPGLYFLRCNGISKKIIVE